ncbi:MAG TPA: DNA repair protein RecO [Bacteroidales bacterium]|nr:MAG: DNA repair protein RecO [Bacteroidetes bacterium GWF2_33_38]OFY74068.1 MAG: DNA repair protein RecO [Bacteroidetes bacterium RIFOXYA12_FULL_33_9]OFY90272.1 MAG: DNA repair protein RecO [Bacteroidetes bacterium RIFOXYA2_FULL_33_7]HBF87385.1 DNA repair protein RecO [Bacteroidales bacterium]
MLYKTRGIVLHQVKYDDKKRIITIYTEDFGRCTYIVSNSKKNKITLFRPFYILDLEVIHKPNARLHKVLEVNVNINFNSIPFDCGKSSIAMFLSEVLYKILKEESANKEMFNFIVESIRHLDEKEVNASFFHIIFLIKIAKYFGFFPSGQFSEHTPFFDMLEGSFCDTIPHHSHFLNPQKSEIFSNCLSLDFSSSMKISKIEKNDLLRTILNFYRIHHESLGEIKSLDVLIAVFLEE